MLISSVITLILGILIIPYALEFMRVPPSAYSYVREYLIILYIGIPFSFLFAASLSVIKAFGRTKLAMKLSILAIVINMILDPVMIFGLFSLPRLGVRGCCSINCYSGCNRLYNLPLYCLLWGDGDIGKSSGP
ncbi:MATE family efflux transporter [Thermococcus peptonophilus]|uniref:MATE family efflux transporter n=1 Tax=Thermococcus peptonophilus TaxID=53952 RepID=UPI003466EDD7